MADEPQLHDLTKLLLKRLESNPEEFNKTITSSHKWSNAVETVRHCGPKSDWETLLAALHEHYMGVGLEAALKLLLNGDESADGCVGQSSKRSWVQGTPGGPAMSGSNINSLQNQQQLSQLTYEEMLAQVRAQMPPLGVPTTTALTSFGQIKKRLGL